MNTTRTTLLAASALGLAFLAGCASAPTAPSLMALPGTGKSFEQFRYDDNDCRNYARQQTAGTSDDAGVRSAVVGTAVGAVAGAAIGGHQGAGVGAGTGLIVGSVAGSGASSNANYGSQRHYDNAYVQCMYGKGHKVPVSGNFTQSPASQPAPAQSRIERAPAAVPPPPPPGNPPPPPPGN